MIWELLAGLGLGKQLFAAALMMVVAWYLLRAVSMAGTVGVAVTSGIMYVVVTVVAVAVAFALGWLDPRPGAIQHTIGGLQNLVEDYVLDLLDDLLSARVKG